ncbi:dispatched homolog 2 (Drosophila) (predicted), isoform CRA_a [Rattus norvegicus]|uniref:Dispatched homolog 2 (Drosophila) (Predicted), isoform CRA_a n=1 Tax=Rattus norvegicus TaxID=10116 RepID=A6HPC8_RAT|nr:dispatched homolog 2 (Drosophila) (predicted), isoform CRA_a [Rattus norvegicus]
MQALTGPKNLFSLSPDPEVNSSTLLSTLSPAAWGRAEESVVRTKRMVGPVEVKEEENFFCGPPEKKLAKLVFVSTSGGSLWNLQAIHSMCRIEQEQVSWLGTCQGVGGNQGH